MSAPAAHLDTDLSAFRPNEMHWTWLLAQRGLTYEAWIWWHYHVLLGGVRP